jgi:hypothetical protein
MTENIAETPQTPEKKRIMAPKFFPDMDDQLENMPSPERIMAKMKNNPELKITNMTTS